jgi:CHAD domain-containing protein
MGYCFIEHETVAEGIKRMAREQLDKAIAQTKQQVKNRNEAVHVARVATKKLRALLRLARSQKTTDFFAKEVCCYRNASRLLSEVGDATVMIEAFDKLTERYAEQLTPNAFAELRKPFVKTRKQQLSSQNKALQQVAEMLKSARPRVAKWPINGHDFCLLHDGLKRIYKKGLVCMEHVRVEPSVETYHKWRKRVKDLRYQVRLLKPTCLPR